MIRCDGCGHDCEVQQVLMVKDYGHQVRYCADCVDIYRDFVIACQGRERAMQAELDAWILELRSGLRLLLCPMDLRLTPTAEQGMVLS